MRSQDLRHASPLQGSSCRMAGEKLLRNDPSGGSRTFYATSISQLAMPSFEAELVGVGSLLLKPNSQNGAARSMLLSMLLQSARCSNAELHQASFTLPHPDAAGKARPACTWQHRIAEQANWC